MAQPSINVMLREYWNIGTADKPSGPPIERPKGMAKLFIKFCCPPTDVVDMLKLYKALTKQLTKLSKVLMTAVVLVVPAWLWLIRWTWRSACADVESTSPPSSAFSCLPPGHVVGIALGGFLLLLLAETLTQVEAQRAARRSGALFTGANPPQAAPTPRKSSDAQHHAGGSGSGHAAGTKHTAAAQQASRAAPPQHSGSHVRPTPSAAPAPVAAPSGGAPKIKHGATLHDVQVLLAKLETVIFGRTAATSGDTGIMDLATRVRKLCAQLGLAFPDAAKTPPSVEVLAGVLAELKQTVGV